MKLNNKRTILVGLAFLSICAFWQMYDSIVPLILTNTFHLNETFSGAIMAADNVLALFLLPIFGGISDRTDTRLGKRMPFILCTASRASMPSTSAATPWVLPLQPPVNFTSWITPSSSEKGILLAQVPLVRYS